MMMREIEGGTVEILETFEQESLSVGELLAAAFSKMSAPRFMISSIQRAFLALSIRSGRIIEPDGGEHISTGDELRTVRLRVEYLRRLVLLLFEYYGAASLIQEDMLQLFDYLLAMLAEIENQPVIDRLEPGASKANT